MREAEPLLLLTLETPFMKALTMLRAAVLLLQGFKINLPYRDQDMKVVLRLTTWVSSLLELTDRTKKELNKKIK